MNDAQRRVSFVAPLVVLIAALGQTPKAQVTRSPSVAPPIVITNTTVVDVIAGGRTPGMTVVVREGRIERMGRRIAVPRGALRVDGAGKFLIPGLWDMHSHNQASGVESLDLFVANGVVGTRDMGSDLDFILPLRDRIRRNELLGPEIVAAGPILDDAPPEWPFRRRVTNAEDAREAVRDLKNRGVDFIKVHNNTPREAFFAIADESLKLGLPFAGHIPLTVTIEEGISSGMKSIEHLSESRIFRECPGKGAYSAARCQPIFESIAAKGVWQTPTGAFYQLIPDVFSGKPFPNEEYATDRALELNRANIKAANLDERTLAILRSQNATRLTAVHDLLSSGARFLAGCDAWVPGFCLHDELQWLTEAGLSPLQAIQTATINAARFLEREKDQGTVETGKRADLTLLEGDPLVDIHNTRRVAAVVVRGRLLSRTEIDRMVAARRRRARP